MKHLVAPSLLSADFGHLAKDIEMVNRSEADWFHLDIMDGNFVPNFSFGFPVMRAIAELARKPLDVHLMVTEPDRYIPKFREAGAHVISVHYEACTHLHRTLSLIRETGALAGVVLNPHTSPLLLEEVLPDLDLILIMSVNPGYGGQKFIPQSLSKITRTKQMIRKSGDNILIEVDGGISLDNFKDVVNAGADVIVAGYTVFSSKDPVKIIAQLKDL